MGGSATGFDAWCEACQLAQALATAPGPASRCKRCGAMLFERPRFVELWGTLQQLDAVLAAWCCVPAPLATLLPERPVFLTDLDPPGLRADDPEPLRSQLGYLARGDWRAVLAASGAGPRAAAARAIAHERMGDSAAAIAAWDLVLAAGEDARARLARGSLYARAGRRAQAEIDLRHAGDSFPARWCRAALIVTEALAGGAGMPDAAVLARARAEAREPSAYWSDPTVGRLLFSSVVARALRSDANEPRHASAPPRASEETRSLLRAAEGQLEHDTFWDRALALVGWVRVGAADEAERVAAPLARAQASALRAEPAIAGRPLHDVASAVAAATTAIDAGEPEVARRAIAGALAREDLRRFRVPCARCDRGSIGIEEVREALADEG